MKTLLSILALCGVLTADAATVGGISLPARRGDLALHGAGLLRKGFIFKIYVGALYVENANHVNDILADVPKRIDIHYFHDTPKKYMVHEAEKVLAKNVAPDRLKVLEPKIAQLHEAFKDGEKGATASILFTPGEGLTYQFNGESVINIPCDEFAAAYFSIWLGAQPSSRTMKKAMLEGSKG